MKILSCIVVHDRPELTERTIASYLATTEHLERLLVILDSGSADPTLELLSRLWFGKRSQEIGNIVFLGFSDNLYPGKACNRGWEHGLRFAAEATHLHRSDNDVEYQPGWWEHVAERFDQEPELGQLGLLEERYEEGCFNVGGNCVIRRELWDAGVRWDETRWGANPASPALNEDALMSSEIANRGYRIGRVQRQCVKHLGWDFDQYPGYYEESARTRGYDPQWLREHFDRMRTL